MKAFKVHLKKMVFTSIFVVTVISLYLLCFSQQVGYKDNGDPITLLEYFVDWSDGMLWRIPGEDIRLVFQYRGGGWLQMFLPLLGSLGFVHLYAQEKSSTYERYEVFRTGKYRHRIGRFFAAVISGGLQLGIAYGLFGLTILIRYRLLVEADWKELGIYVLEMFLYGALFTLPALVLSVWMQNVYLITSLSFLLLYIPERISVRLIGKACTDIMNMDHDLLNFAYQINPSRLAELCTKGMYQRVAIIEAVLLLTVSFGIYVLGKRE